MNHRSWLEQYPEGVPKQVDAKHFHSICEIFDQAVVSFRKKPAFTCMGSTLTFEELENLSEAFAVFLQRELKIHQGERFAIMLPNCLQYPVALFGALRAGLTIVNTNPLYTPREMLHQLKDSGAKAIIILSNFAHRLEEILSQTNIEHVIITNIGDLLGGLKGRLVNFWVKNVKGMIPKYDIEKVHTFRHAIDEGKKHSLRKVNIQADDIAFLQYTGGTTGISKGAMLTHQNITTNIEQCEYWMKKELIEGEEIVITALPLYHIFALTVNCLLFVRYGCQNILITNPRDMDAFIKDLRRYRFTVFFGVNTLYNALMNHPDFGKIKFDSVKICIAGGMALQPGVFERWKQLTGKIIAEGYGLSETSPVVCCNRIDGQARVGTVGLPLPGTDVKIADETGHEVPFGQPGEILVMGPQVMKGYWNQPEETANAMHGHWFKTGDIGIMEPDGYVSIIDRKKDMILVSGFNVYPNEIEAVVAAHPKVKECAAVGIPDPDTGEKVRLFVVKKDPTLTEEEINALCKEQLTNYKRPKEIIFREHLPKSPVGKILRRELRQAQA